MASTEQKILHSEVSAEVVGERFSELTNLISGVKPLLNKKSSDAILGLLFDSVIIKSDVLDSSKATVSPFILNFILKKWTKGDQLVGSFANFVDIAINSGLIEAPLVEKIASSPSSVLEAFEQIVESQAKV